jgi:hypothetical protein
MVPKLKINGNNVITKRNGKRTKKCYALSSPNKWGYKSNSVYVIPAASTKCSVYSGDDKKLQKCITPPAPRGTRSLLTDWCFRHRQYEVDYSLVE